MYTVWFDVDGLAEFRKEIQADMAVVEPDGSLVLYNGLIERCNQALKVVVAGFAPGIWKKFVEGESK